MNHPRNTQANIEINFPCSHDDPLLQKLLFQCILASHFMFLIRFSIRAIFFEASCTNNQELIKRINELENKLADATKKIKKTKEDYTSIKKERNIVMKKTRILEDTIKETYVELDKQVQLKEKYQEEKKSTYRDH